MLRAALPVVGETARSSFRMPHRGVGQLPGQDRHAQQRLRPRRLVRRDFAFAFLMNHVDV
jgi:hypothetical protein